MGNGHETDVHVPESEFINVISAVVVEVGFEVYRAELAAELPFTVGKGRPELEGGDILIPVSGRIEPLKLVIQPGIKGEVKGIGACLVLLHLSLYVPRRRSFCIILGMGAGRHPAGYQKAREYCAENCSSNIHILLLLLKLECWGSGVEGDSFSFTRHSTFTLP
jgi:hypothetical protein